MKAKLGFALVVVMLLWGMAGCRADTTVLDPAAQATARALQTWIPATATQRAAAQPNPYAQLQTAQARATQVAREAQATLALRQTLEARLQDATWQAFAPVRAALPFYGVDPALGRPGWLEPYYVLRAEGYRSIEFGTPHPETVMQDGVLHAEVTWDTKYGTAGCGFFLRANGDDVKPSQYVVLFTRMGYGFFSIYKDGQLANLRLLWPRTQDRKFNWRNGSSNQFTVVLQGRRIAVYSNRTLLREFDPNEPPSLYVPQLTPPITRISDGTRVPPFSPPPPPAPPEDPEDEAGLAWYRSAMGAYIETLKQAFRDYLTYLNDLIGRETDPNRRQALTAYRDKVTQEQDLMLRTADAVQVFIQAPNQDLNLGPGFAGFVAAAESGYAQCAFRDAWLWILDPPAP
ncbi:MAG: hypothetical protein GXO36_06790 [Chloroflexi bacterium]|nr:hypothetical protein [Chloroflexota bacterium]